MCGTGKINLDDALNFPQVSQKRENAPPGNPAEPHPAFFLGLHIYITKLDSQIKKANWHAHYDANCISYVEYMYDRWLDGFVKFKM